MIRLAPAALGSLLALILMTTATAEAQDSAIRDSFSDSVRAVAPPSGPDRHEYFREVVSRLDSAYVERCDERLFAEHFVLRAEAYWTFCRNYLLGPAASVSDTVPPSPQTGGALTVYGAASGTGTRTQGIDLPAGLIVCTSRVSGNETAFGNPGNFSVWLHGETDRELLANESTSGDSFDKVIRSSGGSFLVEINAESDASWTISCQPPG